MAINLPREKWDICKFCGFVRKETQGNNGHPRCPRQGCAGQHVERGLPLPKDFKG